MHLWWIKVVISSLTDPKLLNGSVVRYVICEQYLDVVSMSGAVGVSVVSVGGGVLHMRGVDGDSSSLLFRSIIYILICLITCTTGLSKDWRNRWRKYSQRNNFWSLGPKSKSLIYLWWLQRSVWFYHDLHDQWSRCSNGVYYERKPSLPLLRNSFDLEEPHTKREKKTFIHFNITCIM